LEDSWSDDGTARLWAVGLEERILEFQVRSGTSLRRSDDLKLLTFEEWMDKKRELEAMRAKHQSTKRE
jgi:hypothetical protein